LSPGCPRLVTSVTCRFTALLLANALSPPWVVLLSPLCHQCCHRGTLNLKSLLLPPNSLLPAACCSWFSLQSANSSSSTFQSWSVKGCGNHLAWMEKRVRISSQLLKISRRMQNFLFYIFANLRCNAILPSSSSNNIALTKNFEKGKAKH
jgi:hypothetical protein